MGAGIIFIGINVGPIWIRFESYSDPVEFPLGIQFGPDGKESDWDHVGTLLASDRNTRGVHLESEWQPVVILLQSYGAHWDPIWSPIGILLEYHVGSY